MQDGLRAGFQDNRDKIGNGMLFFRMCHQAANNGMMQNWREEKLGGIESGLTDLASRKNSDHANYTRTVANIQSWLAS